MRKFRKNQKAKSRLPHKTTQLRKSARAEYAHRYADQEKYPPDLLGLRKGGGVCWGHASHADTRDRLAEELALEVGNDFDPGSPMDFLTLVHKGWITPAANPVIDIVAIKRRARDCFRDLGFCGIAIIEFDLLLAKKDDPAGHQIMPHVHAIGHIDRRRARRTIGQLKMSKRLDPPWGCPTVVRKTLNTLEEVLHVVAYPLKLPVRTKRRVPSKKRPGKWKFRTNAQRQVHALSRIVEVISYCSQKDLLFTAGGRSHWLTNACARLSKRGETRTKWYTDEQLKAIWARIHAENRFAEFGEMKVRTK